MTSSSFAAAVCLHIVFCVCSSSENRLNLDNIYFRRLSELVLAGADTSEILCGSSNVPTSSLYVEREAEIVELVNAGYRFFDLAVEEVDGELHWSLSPHNNMATGRSRSREITRDLQMLATSVLQHSSELFVLRLSVYDAKTDSKISAASVTSPLPGNSGQMASGCRLLHVVVREFGARLIRSTVLTKEGVTVGNILAGGGNVAVFVRNLKDVDRCVNSSSGHLPVREFFLTDDVIVTVGPSMYEVIDGDSGDDVDVVLETHRAVSGLSHVILRTSDSGDDTGRSAVVKFSSVFRLTFKWFPLCALLVFLTVVPLNWRLNTFCRLPYVTCTVLFTWSHIANHATPVATVFDFRRAGHPPSRAVDSSLQCEGKMPLDFRTGEEARVRTRRCDDSNWD
jgi:hypothetical protein